MISKIKKPVSILLSLIMVFSMFAIVPLSASAAYWYYDLARGTLIQPGDTFSFEDIGSFKFADYNDPTIIHEVKGSDFSYNQATLSVTDGYYSFGSTKLLPTSVSPGGLLIADYDSTTKMATFGVQNITHSFDETTGTLTIGGSGVVPRDYAFTGSDVYGVVFAQSNLVKHLIIDATDMIAVKKDAFMAYTGGCVLEDVEINSTSSTPLIIENQAIFYEKDSAVTITVNAAKLATVTSSPVNNYGSPVNLIYNVEQPITFNQRAFSSFYGDLTVTFPTHCNIFIPGGAQFTDSQLQEEYDMLAEDGYEEDFWYMHSDLVEGTDYVLGDARYEDLTPLTASLVVGNNNTALFSAYTITDESVNGTVTASVGGTDVTEAEPDSTVLLTVAPDSGYQFKSITAIVAKYSVEEFSDLVAVMGDAEFEAAEYADHTEHTCKAEDGKFVVYNGTTPVTELSESDITDVSGLSGNSPMITCGNIRWYFGVSNGKITSIEAVNTSSWDYLFESANGSESTGTLPPADFALTTVTEGSQYSFTMPKRAVTVTAEFEEAPASASASFVKVTDEPDDWSGDYLIVYEDEDGSTAFNGSADELNSKGNYIDVTISGGEIESNAATDAAKVTIAQIDGGYSIATVDGAYIGGVSGQNKLDFRDEAILNTISLEDDSAKIVSNTSTLRFNTTWVGFRYYKTVSQKPVQLYKLTGGSAPTTYTVTWKNGDTVLETDENVAAGTTPSYDGATPTKDGVTFVGWTDSHGVFYAKDATLPEVTADETYTAVFELTIGSVDEWNSFAASVKGGNTYSGIIVRMTADVGPVTTMVDGTFSGTFDGDGHTLTVNISGGSTSAATFAYVKDATIQNLRLEGTVTSSGIHTAALVKSVSDTGSTCTIKNVDIYADVNCSNNYIGGFIGHAGTANTVNIENSIFAGSINKTGSTQGNFIGAFIGWSQTLTATINNCAFTGSYNNIKSFNNIGFSYNAPTKVTVSGFYSNASEVFVANVNHGTRLYVPSSSYPTSVALVKNNDGETFYSAFSDALAAWTDGSTLALLADVTCDSMISVPADTSKILDLNGKTLTTVANNTVYGTLTIQSTVSGGNITHTNKSQVISVQEEATLNINSGTIHGYNADRAVIGGAEGGTYNLNGGKIVTSASNAFSIGSGSTLNLNGGEIECTSDSTSMGTASAVWAHGDSTINWNGTAITTNTGDGIRMKSAGNGTVNVTGGSFTATSSSLPEEGGYAIYCNSNMGTLNLEGNPSFSGRGIYLTNDKVINITDDLSNTNPISVTMQTPGVFTSGLSGNGDASNFANGNGTGYALTLNASGEAQIVSTYTITWNNWDDTELEKDTGVAAGSTPTYDGETPYKADGADCIYTFSGWTPEVSAVTGDATYTAQFTESEKPEAIKDCNNKFGDFRLYSNVPLVQYSDFNDILDGAVMVLTYGDRNTMIPVQDAKGYSYKFYDQTGTEIPAVIANSSSDPGSNYGFSDDVTVYTNVINFTRSAGCTAIYIVATEPTPSTYTITWNNYDDTEIGTSTVDADENPVFSDAIGEIKEYPDDDYTFAGWTDSNGTFYAKDADLPAASADETYTATFEKLALKHSVTLNGNVNLNFYLNPDLVKVGDTVSFTWDVEDAEGYGTHSYIVKESDLRDDGYFVYVGVPAAEMTYGITASVNGVSVSDTFSVRDYCEAILADDSKSAEIKDLVKAMLYYGAKAQIAFGVKTDDLANAGVGADYDGAYADLTEAMINGAIYEANHAYADDLTDLPIGTYKTTSLFFLTRNIIRHYFKNTDASDSWTGITNDNFYRYVDSGEIAAAELDELQTFTVDSTTFRYSALDYVKELLKSDNVAYKNLAYATYWYNQKANTYFDNLNNN